MNKNTIDRTASDKTKGFRLQKLRAIKLMLDQIALDKDQLFYTAIEHVEDVSHTVVNESSIDEYYEEDKFYENTNFTLISDAVKNTLVSFYDIYAGTWQSSNNIRLGFYTTAQIGREQKKVKVDDLDLPMPHKPVLEILSEGVALDEATFNYFKAVLSEEYKKQYFTQPNEKDKNYENALRKQEERLNASNYSQLVDMNKEETEAFLSKIHWFFGREDDSSLKTQIHDMIRSSPLSNINTEGKEEIIFSMLMELLDERQNKNRFSDKFISGADIRLTFKEAESEISLLLLDPAWQQLQGESNKIIDKRNLREKLESAYPGFNEELSANFARKACTVKGNNIHGKSFLSLKYRVYLACTDHLLLNKKQYSSEKEVTQTIGNLLTESKDSIDDLKEDFTYKVSSRSVVQCVIYDLFDECFIALDENRNGK